MTNIIILIIIINILTFLLMGIDKFFAIKNHWRISEKTLLLSAILGGGIGSFLGMITSRHKTKKILFKIIIPLSIPINIITYYFIIKNT